MKMTNSGKCDFLNIVTFFESDSERNIYELEKVYKKSELLKDKIREISKGILDNQEVVSGKKILIKPNWVRNSKQPEDEICLRTHNSVILALTEIILELKPEKITIGDAPIQGCNWDKMLDNEFYASVARLSRSFSIPIEIKDFRRTTFDLENNHITREIHPIDEYLIFDLGKESYLEPISTPENKFRVTNYNPDRLKDSHAPGRHKFCITRELFEADVIISVPKIKTHQKTGITGALKNLVGLNGDKDFLPHHRVGGTGFGGDCYPGKNLLRRLSEYFLDNANRQHGKILYWFNFYSSRILWKISLPKPVHRKAAGWYGNDTCWRMVMDLNKIATFGTREGKISNIPQRVIYSLSDGIIGGQGDGPLNPVPLPLGVLSFTNNNAVNDISMAALMGFDYHKIPLLKSSAENILTDKIFLSVNGTETTLARLNELSIPTIPPPGWAEYLISE